MEKLQELINAAERGSVEAMYELGMMYYSGDGVAENEREAMKWLKRAAINGDQVAEEMCRQWNKYRMDEYLVKYFGEEYIEKYGKTVIISKGANMMSQMKPLKPSFPYKLAAYDSLSDKEYELLNRGGYQVGEKLRLRMLSPFYCQIGDTFSVAFGSYRFITCQLLGFTRIKKYYADLTVKVLSEGNHLSFVKELSQAQIAYLKQRRRYDYLPKTSTYNSVTGDTVECHRIDEHLFCVEESNMSDGWYHYIDLIYTDKDGIDHLVYSSSHDEGQSDCLFGDKVLGSHSDCPIKI